jgi:hypothetical protein
VVAAVAAVLVLALVLEPVPDPPLPTASFSGADVARVAKRVERLRGLRFERPVRPRFLDRGEALELVRKVSRSDYPERRRQIDDESLKLLGLLRPSADLVDAIDSVDEDQLLGFYDDHSKRLVVIREPGVTRALLEVTLAHELVHALEDQRFGLDSGEGLPDDSVLAEAALAEGSATALMVDYADKYLSLGDVLELANVPDSEKLPPFVEKLLLFPYVEGVKFIAEFRGEGEGWRPIDSIYRFRRPRSAEQILHPRRYALDERPERVRIPPLAGVLGRGWKKLRATSLGEYDLRLLFDLVGGTRPAGAAEGWGGGRYELWRRGALGEGCEAPCVERDLAVVRVRWDSTRERAEGERELARVWEKGLQGKRLGGRARIRAWSSRGGAIMMRGRGRETTVVLAPDVRLAARALGATG